MTDYPAVSIIVNTDGRAESLRKTIDSLRYLDYPSFEVVVVVGPTRDGTHDYLETVEDLVKVGFCSERNLSQSRNIGIALASADILAFIDDDAIPEPEWLRDIVAAFADARVGVAGGFVYDHTGSQFQWRFGTVDRLAVANQDWDRPAAEFNYPFSFNVPHVLGANSVFRRDAVLDVGGFDEEYEYFLDETDIICRIVDKGWRVAQIDGAYVHHKYLQSHIRNANRCLTAWYPVIKNKTYFCLRHGVRWFTQTEVREEIDNFIAALRRDMQWAMKEGHLSTVVGQQFELEAERGLRDGEGRSCQVTKSRARAWLDGARGGMKLFRSSAASGGAGCFVFLSQNIPPNAFNGISRHIHTLAHEVARLGRQVHLLTTGEGHDRVDFEDGVWVHRLTIKDYESPPETGEGPIPRHIWNYSMTMLAETRRIDAQRTIMAVHAPIWDAEGIAFLYEGSLPLVTSLHTTLRSYLDSNPERRSDAAYMTAFGKPMMAAERLLLLGSAGLLANSRAIVEEIETAYDLVLSGRRVACVPHGLADWTELPYVASAELQEGVIRLVFVGRLEARKGIDVLMRVAPALLRDHPNVWLDIVGRESVSGPNGATWKDSFARAFADDPSFSRVAFHGETSDEALRGFYRAADIVLAPSRFESFGLVHLEALMFGRPVIGCRAGGMVEVINDGETGLLARPGDATSLRECIERLVTDASLRRRMGQQARADYLARFGVRRMAEDEIRFLDRIGAVGASPPRATQRSAVDDVSAVDGTSGRRVDRAKIAIVAGVVTRYDAISDSVVKTWRYLSQSPAFDVCIFAARNDFPDVPVHIVAGVADLLLHPDFLAADALIYHFGVWNPLFDALNVGNGHARQAVFFHNITPLELAPVDDREVIEKSFHQLNALRRADWLWPVSRANAELLLERNFEPSKMSVLPLAVDEPVLRTLSSKTSRRIELLYLGRIVRSKGVLDLVRAIGKIVQRDLPPFRLRIAGNLDFSQSGYCDEIRQAIAAEQLETRVEFIGTVEDAVRDELLQDAHILAIPSYHEGFCKPVVEGLRAGALPVGYAAYNLKYIYEGLGRMVEPQDVSGLADALAELVVDISAARVDAFRTLSLDAGHLSIAEFEKAARGVVCKYDPAVISSSMVRNVSQLLWM